MADIRQDPISGHRVIFAPDRAKRTSDYRTGQASVVAEEVCPFCPGHEQETPAESFSLRDTGGANSPGWRIRVFPNKYPALKPPDGLHEVIVESPDHHETLAKAPLDQVACVLESWQHRIRAMQNAGKVQSAVLFKNHGPAAGATREHPHSQLLGLPFSPPRIAREIDVAAEWERNGKGCPWCSLIEAAEERAILSTGSFVAMCPFAPRFPFEAWLLPVRHAPRFEDGGDMAGLAEVLRGLLRRVNRQLDQPPFNLTLMSAPFLDGRNYHWRIELIPRLVNTAGFEWASGCYINSVPPETAARLLRILPDLE